MDKEKLQGLIGKGWSQREIASFYGKSQSSIRYWLKKFNINTKYHEVNNKKRVEDLKRVVKVSKSLSDLCEKLGRVKGGNGYQNLKLDIEKHNIDISHFDSNHYMKNKIRLKDDEILVYDRANGRRETTSILRRALINKGVNEKQCSKCKGEDVWEGEQLILQIDHIDGNRVNNVINNLRFLCPNCHSQTDTFSRR